MTDTKQWVEPPLFPTDPEQGDPGTSTTEASPNRHPKSQGIVTQADARDRLLDYIINVLINHQLHRRQIGANRDSYKMVQHLAAEATLTMDDAASLDLVRVANWLIGTGQVIDAYVYKESTFGR